MRSLLLVAFSLFLLVFPTRSEATETTLGVAASTAGGVNMVGTYWGDTLVVQGYGGSIGFFNGGGGTVATR